MRCKQAAFKALPYLVLCGSRARPTSLQGAIVGTGAFSNGPKELSFPLLIKKSRLSANLAQQNKTLCAQLSSTAARIAPPRSQMLARLVALVVALALQTVAGQELYITTATSGNGPNSNQYLGIQLVDSAGNLKAQATLGPFQTKGGLTTWNANGVGFAFGDELRFKWTP
jgi:hypothetical protein